MGCVVLVVDDDDDIRDVVQAILEEELDVKTIAAKNGQQALRQVAIAGPCLIVLDLDMPVLDGFEVIRHLKADAPSKNIPVVMVSARDKARQAAVAAGCTAFVPKPFDLDLLVGTVKKHLPAVEPISPEQTLIGIWRIMTALLGGAAADDFLQKAILTAARQHQELASVEHTRRDLTLEALTIGYAGKPMTVAMLGAVTSEVIDALGRLVGRNMTAGLLGDLMPRSSA